MIVFIIIILLISAFVGIVIGAVKGTKQGMESNKQLKNNTEKYNPAYSARLKHISGLPLPNGCVVDVAYCEDKIVLVKENQNFAISKDKINYIETTTGQDLQNQLSGAATGMFLFGLTGAAIGMLSSTVTYILIAYSSNGEDKYIVLDSLNNSNFTSKITKTFKREATPKQETFIDL